MIDLDRLIRDADPARDLEFPPADPDRITLELPPRRRRTKDVVAAVLATAVVVSVAAVALSAGDRHAPPSTGGPVSGARGARPLLTILEILRRPQTAADRAAWVTVSGNAVVPRSERLAATTPWRAQVILFIQRAGRVRPTDRLDLLVATRSSTRGRASLRSTGGSGWTAREIEAGQAVLQQPGGTGNAGKRARLYMVVPDGVARAAFLKGPDTGAGSWLPVPVHNNLAFAQLRNYCCGPSVVARWYDADGRVIKVTGGPSRSRTLGVLRADGIGEVRFGTAPSAARAAIDVMLGQSGGPYTRGGSCGIDHQIKWWDQWTASGEPALTVYFRRRAFVGYQYGDFTSPGQLRKPSGGWRLATTRGLRAGDTLARGQRLYGSAFSISAAQGGSWSARVAGGVLTGYATSASRPGSRQGFVETIDAGHVGCPGVSP